MSIPMNLPSQIKTCFKTNYLWSPTNVAGYFTNYCLANSLENPLGSISSAHPDRYIPWYGMYDKYYVYKYKLVLKFLFGTVEAAVVVAYATTDSAPAVNTYIAAENYRAKSINLQGAYSAIRNNTLVLKGKVRTAMGRDVTSINLSAQYNADPTVLLYNHIVGYALDGTVSSVYCDVTMYQWCILYRGMNE